MKIPFHKDNKDNKKLYKEQKKPNEVLNTLKPFLILEKKKKIILISIVVIFIVFLAILSFAFNGTSTSTSSGHSKVSTITLGKTNDSTVTKEGPYGNRSSNVTIAYIVGVHPRESGAHQAIVDSIREKDAKLEKAYYLYIINAPIYQNNYPKERLNGQKLANEYIVPDIIQNRYQLAVDIHSSNGSYSVDRFIFAPSKGNKSVAISLELKNKLSWIKYYFPPNPSSTEYVTIPLTQSGIPSIIYEAYKYDSNTTNREHANEFIEVIDRSQIFK